MARRTCSSRCSIATTTSTSELLAAGADGYVTKPFNLAALQDMVARTLAASPGTGAGASLAPLDPSHPPITMRS